MKSNHSNHSNNSTPLMTSMMALTIAGQTQANSTSNNSSLYKSNYSYPAHNNATANNASTLRIMPSNTNTTNNNQTHLPQGRGSRKTINPHFIVKTMPKDRWTEPVAMDKKDYSVNQVQNWLESQNRTTQIINDTFSGLHTSDVFPQSNTNLANYNDGNATSTNPNVDYNVNKDFTRNLRETMTDALLKDYYTTYNQRMPHIAKSMLQAGQDIPLTQKDTDLAFLRTTKDGIFHKVNFTGNPLKIYIMPDQDDSVNYNYTSPDPLLPYSRANISDNIVDVTKKAIEAGSKFTNIKLATSAKEADLIVKLSINPDMPKGFAGWSLDKQYVKIDNKTKIVGAIQYASNDISQTNPFAPLHELFHQLEQDHTFGPSNDPNAGINGPFVNNIGSYAYENERVCADPSVSFYSLATAAYKSTANQLFNTTSDLACINGLNNAYGLLNMPTLAKHLGATGPNCTIDNNKYLVGLTVPEGLNMSDPSGACYAIMVQNNNKYNRRRFEDIKLDTSIRATLETMSKYTPDHLANSTIISKSNITQAISILDGNFCELPGNDTARGNDPINIRDRIVSIVQFAAKHNLGPDGLKKALEQYSGELLNKLNAGLIALNQADTDTFNCPATIFPNKAVTIDNTTPVPSSTTPVPSSTTPVSNSDTTMPSSTTPVSNSDTTMPSSTTPVSNSDTTMPSSTTSSAIPSNGSSTNYPTTNPDSTSAPQKGLTENQKKIIIGSIVGSVLAGIVVAAATIGVKKCRDETEDQIQGMVCNNGSFDIEANVGVNNTGVRQTDRF